MKAYLRFRVPQEIALHLSSEAERLLGPTDITCLDPSTYHVTIAYFGVIDETRIPRMNDAISLASIKYVVRPKIRINKLSIFKTPSQRLLVALVNLDNYDYWSECRDFVLGYSGLGALQPHRWNPHVTLGPVLERTTLPDGFSCSRSWSPDRVENVIKTAYTDLIVPVWRFD